MNPLLHRIIGNLVHIWQADEHARLIRYAKSEDEEVRKKAQQALKTRDYLAYAGLGFAGIVGLRSLIREVSKQFFGAHTTRKL
jgi:hypothetical protein